MTDADVLQLISHILWPPEDPEEEWSPDTTEAIADALLRYRPAITPFPDFQP